MKREWAINPSLCIRPCSSSLWSLSLPSIQSTSIPSIGSSPSIRRHLINQTTLPTWSRESKMLTRQSPCWPIHRYAGEYSRRINSSSPSSFKSKSWNKRSTLIRQNTSSYSNLSKLNQPPHLRISLKNGFHNSFGLKFSNWSNYPNDSRNYLIACYQPSRFGGRSYWTRMLIL